MFLLVQPSFLLPSCVSIPVPRLESVSKCALRSFNAVCNLVQAFVYKFSEDMALEYAPFGVKVQCVLPAFVATKMSGFRNTSLQIPSTRDFARNQMNSWGLECSSPGWWFHKLEVTSFHQNQSDNFPNTFIWQWIYYLRLSKIFPSAMVKVTLNWLLMLRNRALKRQREKERKGDWLFEINVVTSSKCFFLQLKWFTVRATLSKFRESNTTSTKFGLLSRKSRRWASNSLDPVTST